MRDMIWIHLKKELSYVTGFGAARNDWKGQILSVYGKSSNLISAERFEHQTVTIEPLKIFIHQDDGSLLIRDIENIKEIWAIPFENIEYLIVDSPSPDEREAIAKQWRGDLEKKLREEQGQ